MIITDVQHCGTSTLINISGHLDHASATPLERAIDSLTGYERDLMLDVHGMTSMDDAGLLHLLALHHYAEDLQLRVRVVGWQPQPQQLMARIAGIPGPKSATGERFALAGFRRLIETRAQRALDEADPANAWSPDA
ncbi:STAS domain-containing protein [Streptomyces sp. NPDC089919]|uniref:STAS domain-containing protein n=1 Tax=Streptomyces sp. NPDC089919 TaxID=3155188 RepID=UPI003422E61F